MIPLREIYGCVNCGYGLNYTQKNNMTSVVFDTLVGTKA